MINTYPSSVDKSMIFPSSSYLIVIFVKLTLDALPVSEFNGCTSFTSNDNSYSLTSTPLIVSYVQTAVNAISFPDLSFQKKMIKSQVGFVM
jgi:hypothetical protein